MGHDVHRPLGDLDLEPFRFVEALIDRGEVAGELRLGHPLQLEGDRGELAGCRGRGSGTPAAVVAAPSPAVVPTRHRFPPPQAATTSNTTKHEIGHVVLRIILTLLPSRFALTDSSSASGTHPGQRPSAVGGPDQVSSRWETCQGMTSRSARRIRP